MTGPGSPPRVRVCRDCCCGSPHKHPDVDHDGLLSRLRVATRGAAVVDVAGCLLACEKSDVVVVVPGARGRRAGGRPVWLREVLDTAAVDAIASWLHAGGPGLSELPPALSALLTTPGVLGDRVLDDRVLDDRVPVDGVPVGGVRVGGVRGTPVP
ncbi:MAG: hypothetical protein WB441_15510 [Nocardioidaceae bacterium]